MAHNIDMTNSRANIAFLGSREDVWHRLGTEMQPGMDIDAWAKSAGLDWHAHKVPAIAALEGSAFDHIDPAQRFQRVEGMFHVVRGDTGHPLGYVSERYQPVQPRDVLDWFDRYIAVDDRFQLDVAGSLKHGEIIWARAKWREPMDIAGDRHSFGVLMTTTFDGTGSTINKGSSTREVCNNTLDISLADKRAVIRTRHSTKFNPAQVGKELAQIAQGFVAYKAIGDALAQVKMARDDVSKFFKQVLEIEPDAKRDDVSTRKLNQFEELTTALRVTQRERNQASAPGTGSGGDAWECLQAITRYVDHDKSVRRNGESEDAKRFTSAQFGSGAQLKAKAMGLLLPRIKDKVAVAA